MEPYFNWITLLECLSLTHDNNISLAWTSKELKLYREWKNSGKENQLSSVHSFSYVQHFETSCTATCQASLIITNCQSLFKLNVHWVGDATQPSHPLLSPSPPAFNLSQHQGLFKWVSSLRQVAKVLEVQFQQQSFQWIFRTDFF